MNCADETISILLAEDHTIVREALHDLLQKQKNFHVLESTSNGKELLDRVRQHKPHIVITDIAMPLVNGIEATRKIITEFPSTGVIALTMYDETHLLMDIVNAGARGYLLKHASQQELFEAIEVVHDGGTFYTRDISDKLIALAAKTRFRLKPSEQIEFTPLETEIIQLVCEQLSSKEIAERLNLKRRAVESYREKIQRKIGARNMIGIVLYAIKHRLYHPL
ncbi:MAG TPA: response regulator transcription factor [Flavisolibacter sp.]|jgi:DNA-binding NarL/FixJ family response regulator|nr:response regulator transcription factor [Flavisolibacter sp.]